MAASSTRNRPKRIGEIRSSQVITTYGPGALLDLPRHSVIVAGLDTWRPRGGASKQDLRIDEPRLTDKIRRITGIGAPELYRPPPQPDRGGFRSRQMRHIAVRLFPEWFVVQHPDSTAKSTARGRNWTSRRLVRLRELEGGRFEGRPVVATRFVRSCPKGHVDDLDWRHFAHMGKDCSKPAGFLWLDERGQSGDLGDLYVTCQCGEQRRLSDALRWKEEPLGTCTGRRPWLGPHAAEECDEPSRLLIRTASNAYFSQVLRVLSIPEGDASLRKDVDANWHVLERVDSEATLAVLGSIVRDVENLIAKHGGKSILKAIDDKRAGPSSEVPAKLAELDAFLSAPEGYGDDIPIDPDFHARRLPRQHWSRSALSDGIAAVVQLHRLREVSALIGFTRFEAPLPSIDGEYGSETDVTRADLDEDPKWFPAVENRGEGVFISLDADAVARWLNRPAVQERVKHLELGHAEWLRRREKTDPPFPGGPYVLLHSLAHLLMQSMSLRCGYPATSIRERIYLDEEQSRYGLLLYTASPDSDGTLGGLVQQALHIEDHLSMALRAGELCSSDPICAQHSPSDSLDERWLHGAACHNCALIAETSCEMRNEHLDRALVVATVVNAKAEFFGSSA